MGKKHLYGKFKPTKLEINDFVNKLHFVGDIPTACITSLSNTVLTITNEDVAPEPHKCPPHIYDNAKVVVRDGELKTLSKCAYCGFELIF